MSGVLRLIRRRAKWTKFVPRRAGAVSVIPRPAANGDAGRTTVGSFAHTRESVPTPPRRPGPLAFAGAASGREAPPRGSGRPDEVRGEHRGMVAPMVFRGDGDGQVICLGHPSCRGSAAGRAGGARGSERSPPRAPRPPRSSCGGDHGGGRRLDPQLLADPERAVANSLANTSNVHGVLSWREMATIRGPAVCEPISVRAQVLETTPRALVRLAALHGGGGAQGGSAQRGAE